MCVSETSTLNRGVLRAAFRRCPPWLPVPDSELKQLFVLVFPIELVGDATHDALRRGRVL